MMSIRSIPRRARLVVFFVAAAVDLGVRVFAAKLAAGYLIYVQSAPDSAAVTTISHASSAALPVIVAPLILSPIAYIAGYLAVLDSARYTRLVSAILIVASFLVFAINPGMSVLAAVLAYLVLASGTIRSQSFETPATSRS